LAVKYICDRCGGQHNDAEAVVPVQIPHEATRDGFDRIGVYDTFKRDLCASCVSNLHEWLRMKP
jgi:hypothetical protein